MNSQAVFALGPCQRALGSCKRALTAPKAMKAMKATGAGVMKSILKKPAAADPKNLEGSNKQDMSLEDKMELFQKRGAKDVGQFLDSLTKGQREALWQRFASARASLKDKQAEEMWQEVGKGKGSSEPEKKLLATFLKLGGDLKSKKEIWMSELITYTKSSGHSASIQVFLCSSFSCWVEMSTAVPAGKTDSEEWVPFQTILKRYGLQEALRRVAWQHCLWHCVHPPFGAFDGAIACR